MLAMLLLSQLGQGASAEPPDWAQDAVETVQQRGLIQGYPSGELGGVRPMTRNELAELLDRVDEQGESEQSGFASRGDLRQTRQASQGLQDQMDTLKTRVENLEEGSGRLQQRTGEVARPSL
jgi:hypothetical protein